MSAPRPRRLALFGLVAAVTTTACPRLDPMNTGVNKKKAYQTSTEFADGLAMRHPPAGTVPYRSAIDPVVATGIDDDGKPVAASPVEVTAATLACCESWSARTYATTAQRSSTLSSLA